MMHDDDVKAYGFGLLGSDSLLFVYEIITWRRRVCGGGAAGRRRERRRSGTPEEKRWQ